MIRGPPIPMICGQFIPFLTSERGGWKSARKGNSLATYPTAVTLLMFGFTCTRRVHGPCRGQRHGANGHLRLEYESVLQFQRIRCASLSGTTCPTGDTPAPGAQMRCLGGRVASAQPNACSSPARMSGPMNRCRLFVVFWSTVTVVSVL
jgi:hypothetical protein